MTFWQILNIVFNFVKQKCFNMDTPFIYDKYVTGKNFIGRREDCIILGNLISQGENVCIYEPPKSGKMSVIQQTLFNLRMGGFQFVAGQFSMLNIRKISDFLVRFGNTVIRTQATTPDEYQGIMEEYLSGTHFIFDKKQYSETDDIVSLNWETDDNDIREMLSLPYRISRDNGQHFIIIIDEFQNINETEDGDKVLKIFEKVVSESRNNKFSFIFCGSMVNAMKDIFAVKRFFYRNVEHLPLRQADEKEIIEYVVKGFLASGKVIGKELVLGMCKLFRNNLWYINHFTAISDSMSKGYIVESMLMDALDTLISIHEPRFVSIVNSLTTYQISLLRAILDGYSKFSAADVIQKYSFNSSANVKRLKDALMKKEIVTFNENDDPIILDPLFEYWVRKYFFELK